MGKFLIVTCPVCGRNRGVSIHRRSTIAKNLHGARCKPCADAASARARCGPAPARAVCLNCVQMKPKRSRGLCSPCYAVPGLKALYPSTSKFARRSAAAATRAAPLPDNPTAARPGSEEKIAEMERRALLGRAIFHPADLRLTRSA